MDGVAGLGAGWSEMDRFHAARRDQRLGAELGGITSNFNSLHENDVEIRASLANDA